MKQPQRHAPVEKLFRDLRYALRSLARTPGFTFTTILTLAVAIGASTAIFSVVNGILLEPLPFPSSERLITLTHRMPSSGIDRMPASPAIYFTYRDNNETFESVALWSEGSASVTGDRSPEEVRMLATSHEFLSTLGVQPLLGRSFVEADGGDGAEGTVILSYGYWQRRYGGAETALGANLIVDGAPRTVVGVLPRGFRFAQNPADLLLPMQLVRSRVFSGPLGENGIARLKPGVTLAAASADVERMLAIVPEVFPPIPSMDPRIVPSQRLEPNLLPLKSFFVRDLGDTLWVLMGTVGLLLAIACANIANLKLVRTEARARELAIRAALGAGRGEVARLLLLESVLLGLAGGAAGLVLAALALPALLRVAARNLPPVLPVSIDPTVLAFALAISIASGVLFGLIPVLKHCAPRLAAVLSAAGRSSTGSRERHRATNALVVSQVAIALVLLVGSGLMIRTYQSLRDVEPGFADPEHLLTVDISIPPTMESNFDRVIRIQNEIQDRLAALPGVESAAYSSSLPLKGFGPQIGVFFEDKVLASGEAPALRGFRFASPGLFATLGAPLRAGRDFEWAEVYAGRQVAVVTESLARAEWGSAQAALGKRLRLFPTEPWREIVGVVRDIHHGGLDRPAESVVYLPQNHAMAQWSSRRGQFVLRGERVGTAGFLEDVQRAVWSVNPDLPLAAVRTMGDVYRQALARTSLTLTLLAITAAMALALGLVGIYGAISYTLAQRTRELGVRLALGARDLQLQRMLLARVLVLVAAGVALGLGGAAALTRLMGSMLFGVAALDPVTYGAVTVTLVLTAAIAAYLPARRVTRIDPMRALREE